MPRFVIHERMDNNDAHTRGMTQLRKNPRDRRPNSGRYLHRGDRCQVLEEITEGMARIPVIVRVRSPRGATGWVKYEHLHEDTHESEESDLHPLWREDTGGKGGGKGRAA